ncbi:MAG: MurT ligase domain-containing protein [Candidatus Saccharibacteria bacterium]|nr:MurT ligase domain-containing protein [Candidatus Saccharibacteria bacterium]
MFWLTSIIGKSVCWLSRHLGGGHGSALPGLIVEKLYPKFLARLMSQLPDGVVLVTGTNGKTTTTKIIVDLLRADGYRVFTNPSGSNYTRGVISAALPEMRRGQLPADIAVLELDEIYATHFVDQVRPQYSLLLNVLRDQLDRFGEIDNTARLLKYVAEHTNKAVVVNGDDPRLAKLAKNKSISAMVSCFGYSGPASQLYKTDEELHSNTAKLEKKIVKDVLSINKLADNVATYAIDGELYQVKLRLFGSHNALNCAAALALIKAVEGDKFDAGQAVEHLGAIRPAFGRGEIIVVNDGEVRLILVKNPSGFQIALDSAPDLPTLIAINDAHADGRDMSWLWDVNFGKLQKQSVMTTGIRATDMALRLEYDGVSVVKTDDDMDMMVRQFISKLDSGEGQIFASYTAMLKIRDILKQIGQVNDQAN